MMFISLLLVEEGAASRPQINSMLDMALVWDSKANNYYLIGYVFQGNELRFVDRNIGGRAWKVDLGNNPWFRDRTGDSVIDHYGIDLRKVSDLPKNSYFKRFCMG